MPDSNDDSHLTDRWPVAPGHELDQADWDVVKADADEWAGRTMTALASVQIPKHVDIKYPGSGGRKDNGLRSRTQLWVIHTAECPLATGYAVSLSKWGANSSVRASWHRMSDPGTIARFVPTDRAAWHATIANGISKGFEQAGYAAFPRSKWLTPEGLASIDRLAQEIVADGIPAAAVRQLTKGEVDRALAGDHTVLGLCSHAQIQPKDRTDPGAGYPWDVLLERIRFHHPQITQEDDMPSADEVADVVLKRRVVDYYGQDTTVGEAIGITLRNSTRAAIDAQIGRKVAEEAALRGTALSAEQIAQIAKATADEIGQGFTVEGTANVVPKKQPTQPGGAS